MPIQMEMLGRFQKHVARLLQNYSAKGVALALSGGVDSFALAWLWHTSNGQAWKAPGLHPSIFGRPLEAIIVDHKLRPESTVEAQLTANRFKHLTGRHAHIIQLDWNPDQIKKSKWETEARKLRYQALARVCLREGFDTILTGHHADDQIETALARLVSQNGTVGGLGGMAPISPLPECENLNGLHDFAYGPGVLNEGRETDTRPDESGIRFHDPMQGPAVTLVRPLLPFHKAELYKVCDAVGQDWAEDPSNKVPTVTNRNAIRQILSSGDLPRALQTQRLQQVVKTAQDADAAEYDNVRSLHLQTTGGKRFRPSVGSLELPLPLLQDLPRSHALTYLRDIVGAVGKNFPSRQDCEGLLKDIIHVQHAAQSMLERLYTKNKLRNRKLKLMKEIRVLNGFGAFPMIIDEVMRTKAPGPAPATKKWVFLRVRDFDRRGKGPSAPEMHLVRMADESGFYMTNPDHPKPTLWDCRFWMKVCVRLEYEGQFPQGLMVGHLRREAKHGFDMLPDVHHERVGDWIEREKENHLGHLPLVPVLTETKAHHADRTSSPTGGVDMKRYAHGIIAIPAAGYVSPKWRKRTQVDLAYKDIKDVKLGCSMEEDVYQNRRQSGPSHVDAKIQHNTVPQDQGHLVVEADADEGAKSSKEEPHVLAA